MRDARSTPRPFPLVLTALLALLLGVIAQPAPAQDLVPEQITTPDLKPVIDTLGLSSQQTLSLLPLHDAYKERYSAFQNNDVKKLRDQLIGIGLRFAQGQFQIPERKELEEIVRDFKQLLDRARTLDRGFFTEVGTLLSDEQMPRLERARINRELKVYREILGGIGEMNRGSSVNLSEMTRGLDLSPQEREQTDLVLNEYEAALLAKSHDIYTMLTEVASVVLDFIDESGIRGMTIEQIAAWGEKPPENLINRAQTVFDEASKPIQQAAWELSQLNVRTFKRISAVLSEKNQRELRDRYYRRAYREVYPHEPQWEGRYRAALKLEGLTDDQRTSIESQSDGYRSQSDSAINSGVDALEDGRKYKTFRQFSRQDDDPVQEKVNAAVERTRMISESAVVTLNSLLGETLVAQLDKSLKKDPQQAAREIRARANDQTFDGEATVEVSVGVNGSTTIQTIEGRIDDESTRYLPQAMGIKSFQQTLEALALNEDDRDVAMTIFDSYRTDFETLRSVGVKVATNDEVDADADAEPSSQPAHNAPGGAAQAATTPTEVAKARAARQDELAAIDERLFDDLALLVKDDAARQTLEMFRTARRRSATAEISKMMATSFDEDEAYIDLVAMVRWQRAFCRFAEAGAAGSGRIRCARRRACAVAVGVGARSAAPFGCDAARSAPAAERR